MPEVSIVIPAYLATDAQFDWLSEALMSIQTQTGPSCEVIIVDDASPVALDGPSTGQLRVIHHDRRRGAGAARNTGIAAATGEYILCLDADDRLKPEALQTLWQARCPAGVVYGDLEYIGERTGLHTLPGWSLELLLRGASPLPITALHPRTAWRQVGGFDEQLPGMEDVDYWIKLAAIGVCGRRIPHIIFEYRRHGESRQAGLEANNRARMRQCVEIIQARHRKVASEMVAVTKKCSKCPGGSGQGEGVTTDIPEGVGGETVQLRYVGPMQGSFRAIGFETGAKYFINGRGDTITVDVRDAAGLLKRATGGRPDFEVLPDQEPAALAVTTPVQAGQIDNPAPTLPVITGLSVKDAEPLIAATADLPDLAIWLAEERASDKPRKTVIEALEARIAALQSV